MQMGYIPAIINPHENEDAPESSAASFLVLEIVNRKETYKQL